MWSEQEYQDWKDNLRSNGARPAEAPPDDDKPSPSPAAEPRSQRVDREHREQTHLIRLCTAKEAEYPELALLYAIPNGGHRRASVAGRMKAEGVKAGVPDLHLPVPRCGYASLYIEMKAPPDELRGTPAGRLRDSQKAWLDRLQAEGHACVVAYGWEQAWAVLEGYLTDAFEERGPLYPPLTSVNDILRWAYRRAIEATDTVAAAARQLKVSRQTLYNKIDPSDEAE